ncbi:hypothetical protein CKO28_00065 [Rhodovibrio sodomensis]|uniref:Uncharacterized protein n=1 Tax=Rhodovibrio sodomensis TaxID=1088 RepID=A0ABS1D7N5_9PROT|nr:hypothetical protein [Rhodovibrio sodomensis]MBK1666433.1 hypothetical protein [Rhodovibrio sodomensis]
MIHGTARQLVPLLTMALTAGLLASLWGHLTREPWRNIEQIFAGAGLLWLYLGLLGFGFHRRRDGTFDWRRVTPYDRAAASWLLGLFASFIQSI